jgi:hypothetical protein
MLTGNVDTLLCVLGFASLDEWVRVAWLSRSHWAKLKVILPKWMGVQVQARLNSLLTSQLDVQQFWKYVQESGGYVSGSIHLQLLLGVDKFRANDVDVFITSSSDDFTNLHRFLFRISTGMVSEETRSLTVEELARARKCVECNPLDRFTEEAPRIVAWDYAHDMWWTCPAKFDVRHVYTYHINELKIQVITVCQKEFPRTRSETRRCILERFDICSAMSMCNNQNTYLHSVMDVFRRTLTFSKSFLLRAQFFDSAQSEVYKKRTQKYLDRKFTFDTNPDYGRFNKKIRTLGQRFRLEMSNIEMEDMVKALETNSCDEQFFKKQRTK